MVWTDVFQLIVTMVGLFIVDVIGVIEVGGFKNLFEISAAGGRLQFFK